MARISKKKRVAVATVTLLGVGGAAFAYWTQGGSGSGAGTTGDTVPVVVNQTSTVADLAPGAGTQALSGNFDNPNEGPVRIGSVTATVTGTDKGAACDATNYVIGGTATVNAEIPAGTGVGSWSGLTIAFVNKAAVNQDACKGAVVDISYTSN